MNRCIALIDSGSLLNNIELVRKISGYNNTIVMVKANAYGHGLLKIASILKNDPAVFFGVAAVKEALLLRRQGITNPIFLFDGGASAENPKDLFDLSITPVISSRRALASLLHHSARNESLSVHLKIDTGFMRNGFWYEDLLKGRFDDDFLQLKECPHLRLMGIATHFSMADELDSSFTARQLQHFENSLNYLSKLGLPINCVHFANSAALLRNIALSPSCNYPVVNRPGLLAYGLSPLPTKHPFKAVMSIKAQIVAIKHLNEGEGVGYGQSYFAQRKRRVGVVAMGYGDGLKRCLSNRIDVLIHGQRAPLIGTISMDSCTIDLSEVEHAREGDLVTLLGQEQDQHITANDWAQKANTIVWEILTSITARLEKIVV